MAQFKNTTLSSTGNLTLPAGTTAQRPGTPLQGMIRYNTTLNYTEYYDGGAWREITDTGAEATGGFTVDYKQGGIEYRSHYFRTNEFAYVSRLSASGAFGSGGTGSSTVRGEVDQLAGGCSPLLTFEQALEFVHSIGCRLPTIDEIINDEAAVGSGCGYDNELIWTCDKVDAEASQHYTLYGRVATNGSTLFPKDNSETARVRYVADVDTGRTDPVRIDDRIIQGFLEEYYSADIDLGTTTLTFDVTKGGEVEYLIVAGGGGGGSDRAGGGGGGGVITGFTTVSPGPYNITVGAGGQGGQGDQVNGSQGANSSAFGFTAIGGGFGSYQTQTAGTGGSGGGGGGTDNGGSGAGGAGTAGQGNAGGSGNINGGSSTTGASGGGGGAGGPGQDGVSAVKAGDGGIGILSSISGVNTYYGGGGGGGTDTRGTTIPGNGGPGGGGRGGTRSPNYGGTLYPRNGVPNTGGGGGGGGLDPINGDSNFYGGDGGSGIVIVRYKKNKGTLTAPTLILNSSYAGSAPFTAQNPAPSAAYITQLGLPNGWYWVNLQGPQYVYVNTQYKGGGWYLVIQNNKDSGNGIGGISYDDASGQRQIFANSQAGDDLGTFNLWTGMELWKIMTNGGGGQVAQVVAPVPIDLDENFTKRATWSYTGFNSYYGFQGAAIINSSSDQPGMYSYHAVNGYNLTTTDRDQDVNGGNCANNYGGNPFWYGSCWSGNAWGGGSSGGYANAYFWTSSGGDNHPYGATYVRASY